MAIILCRTIALFFTPIAICLKFDASNREILFQDDFEGTELNRTAWQVQTGHDKFGENRLMCFEDNAENIKVENGKLIITAIVKEVNCSGKSYDIKDYTSGRVKTREAWDFTALEFKGKITKCKYCQPGFWSQKSNSNCYEEVDDMEAKGDNTKEYYVNAHYGRNYSHLTRKKVSVKVNVGKDLSKKFHTYTVEKTNNELKFYFDGELKASITRSKSDWRDSYAADLIPPNSNTPFSESMNVIISLLIGGNWFKDQPELTKDIANKWTKSTLEVEHVIVYGKRK